MQMNISVRTEVVDVSTGLCSYPQLVIRIDKQIPTIDHLARLILQQQVPQIARGEIQFLHTLSYGANVKAIVCTRHDIHHHIILEYLAAIFLREIRMQCLQIIF